MKKSSNIALILAGGMGGRMRAAIPKQFMEIDGETVLLHTLKAFQQHPLIHGIYIVCMPEWEAFVRSEAERGGIDKLGGVIAAGETSYRSACNGIACLAKEVDDPEALVLVHDAVRPLKARSMNPR